MLLATTSEADALLAREAIAVVRLPAPGAARRAGFSDAERRRLVRGAIEGVVRSFGPDLVVADTFPSGPHGELASLGRGPAKRALVRRSVPAARANDDVLTAGLADHDLAIVADDPVAHDGEAALPIPALRVPPITLAEAGEALPREEARAALGLPAGARAVLVATGGGGDADGTARARAIARAIARVAPEVVVVLADGPLATTADDGAPGARVVRVAPLQPVLAAFDGAFAAAGYNTAHELAKARVPAALFALPRPFDDQAGRAARFAARSLAVPFDLDVDAIDDRVRGALAWMAGARVPGVEPGGADRAAEILLDLTTGRDPATRAGSAAP